MKFVLWILLTIQLATANLSDSFLSDEIDCDTLYFYTVESGTITSPNFPQDYPANHTQTWIFFTDVGKNIQIKFSTFLTQEDQDYVEVYDGPTLTSQLLLNHSGIGVPNKNPVISTSNSMLVQMVTNGDEEQFAGFTAEFNSFGSTTPPAKCGGNFYGRGVIESPDHPGEYDSNINCIWHLWSNSQFISLNFTEFNTENKADWVEVFEGPTTDGAIIANISGTPALPIQLRSNTTNQLTVRFTSDSDTSFSGFRALFN